MKRFVCLSVIGLTGCSNTALSPGNDAAVDNDAATPDAATDAPAVFDAAPDAVAPFVKPTPFAIPLSAGGPDQLQSAVAGPNGTFYLAGFAAQTLTGAKYVTVVKRTATGLDTTFGTAGIATTAVEFAGGSDEIDIAVQPSGKIIVAATVANATNSADRDIAVLRLGTDGKLDTTFGTSGVRILDLNTAVDATLAAQRDASRGLAIGAGGIIYVHGIQRGLLTRTDSDFAVVRLTENGTVDTTFGTAGKFTVDFGSPSANATARGIHVMSDGSIIAGGYASSSISGDTPQPVLYKLTSAGALDTAFAEKGLFHATVLTLQTEVYDFAVHGTNLVTGGYGRNTGTTNDWISLRFDSATGKRDMTWGTSGAVFFDPSGTNLGSNCRNSIALPNGKTLLLGSTGPSNTPQQNAVFSIVTGTGALDTSYGTGINVFPFGTGEGGSDQFWGGATSGNYIIAVGFKGAGTTQTEQLNDDAYGVIFPLQ